MNNKFITTKQVAKILNISDSTVRRWSNQGKLPCLSDSLTNYRKFETNEIMKIYTKMYKNLSVFDSSRIEHTKIKVFDKEIQSLPHPKHYMMHRYWGRKAHNVITEYINFYTNPGDTILDPFMGSGVTIIESLKNNRSAIGVDINPMSKFICENTISSIDLNTFTLEYKNIDLNLRNNHSWMYITKCPVCNADSQIETSVWEDDKLIRIRAICKTHNLFVKDPDEYDFNLIRNIDNTFSELDRSGKLTYPKDEIMQYVKRNGRTYIYELFTKRALIILSDLIKNINCVEDVASRNLLLLCFTSMLPNISRMLPADREKGTYKSGWVISKFWTPPIHTERTIFNAFKLRFNTILKGKKELIGINNNNNAKIHIGDAANLSNIEDESIDYIFTDPPYGEAIAYLALSHFWNSWLNNNVDYDNEIIIDSYREKSIDDFKTNIFKAYSEMYRVLKPNKYLSFTFHSRDLKVWRAILESTLLAGFKLVNITMQPQAVSSGTQGINKKNTLKGDLIYNFIKPNSKLNDISIAYLKNAEDFILTAINNFITVNNGVTTSELYEYLIPLIVNNHAYIDKKGNTINIEKLIINNFEYISVKKDTKMKLGDNYKWITKEQAKTLNFTQ